MQPTTCPSEQELLGFHLGTLPEQGLDAVADHLEDCALCQTRILRLDGETDPVLTVLRSSDEAGRPAEARAIGPVGASLPAGLLDPPQGSDELGRLGHYRLLRVIGRGGMGFVLEGEDLRLRRRVAVKVIQPALAEDTEARQRFLREARAMAGIRPTEHVVTIYDVDEERRIPYLAMELLDGEPLDRWLQRRRPAAVADILRLGREAALGLAVVHEHGLVHRDIKPANLWVEAATGHVKVLDFGLARTAADDQRLTSSNVVAGTPAYLSPEQAQGLTLDARSDLFSLGCVLYELCTGQPPFHGKTLYAQMTALATTDPRPLRSLRPDLPPALATLIAELLARNPARRPPSARVVAQRLEALAAERRGRRPRVLAWAAAAVLLAAGVLFLAVGTIRVQTSKGLVEIHSEDPRVKVIVEQDGELVTILDPESNQRIELRAGEYHVKLSADNPGLKLSANQFTLRRGDKTIVTVRRVVPPPAIDAAWVRQVATLKPADQVKAVAARLRELNPKFKGEVTHQVEDGVVRELGLRPDHVLDLSPVRVLAGLRVLTCAGESPDARQLTDLAPLRGLKLTHLDCGGTGITDLAPLEGMPLTELRCGKCPVSDLGPLKGMRLSGFDCSSTRVTALAPLAGMPLTWLNCSRTPVSDLAPLRGMRLTVLFCDFTDVTDLAPLAGMPLSTLNCGVTRIANLAPLKGMPLKLLGFGRTLVADLGPLKGMPLETLWCDHTAVSDLGPLKGMRLTTLLAGHTKVTSLAALEGMPLRELGFDLKPGIDTLVLRAITTLSVINDMPAAEFWRAAEKKEK